ncbi:zinc-binding metallopeptidase [Saccharicrinis aurantiacus]|uniref:zinc-binding metallopeptidase n=1 Tax=Saccharicrinis aurantiacus TaxID=1849719 RepID=UPI002492638C|nr:putative zinc-binding metallopeptidase [Saccharicrinis aurantiacus]
MIKAIKAYFYITAIIFACSACNKEEQLSESRLDDSPQELSELDQWLRDVFLPYNLEVKYKWEDYEGDFTKNLVPPAEDKVKPLMDVMDKVWIKCYEEEGGEEFIKSYIPKLLYLLGGAGVNPEGTVVQGTAEAGRKIVLYEVNKFDYSDASRINRFFHVMHHEFAHILHQKILYDAATYEEISKGKYRSDWSNVSNSDLESYLGEGFVSPYSMSSRDEDFVEVIAYILTRTKEEWEAYITQPEANIEKLRAKESIVVNYFKNVWNIEIFELQSLIAEKIELLTGVPTTEQSKYESPFIYNSKTAQFCSSCELVHK